MNCADFESILADYVDGTLDTAERVALEQHAAGCVGCREMLADVTGVMTLLKRVEPLEAPAALVTRIAFQTPLGRTIEPFERSNWFSRLTAGWLQPILQPRWVMGMAMTVLSFAMLERCTGVQVQHVEAADLSPMRIVTNLEDKVVRTKDRMMKNYENLRVVYDLETRLRDLEQQTNADDPPTDKGSAKPAHQKQGQGKAK